jgi:hypothetical protein
MRLAPSQPQGAIPRHELIKPAHGGASVIVACGPRDPNGKHRKVGIIREPEHQQHGSPLGYE